MQTSHLGTIYLHVSKEPDTDIREKFISLLNPNIKVHWGTDFDPENRTEILISGRPTTNDIAKLPNLKGIIVPFAGVPQPTLELIRAHPQIRLLNLHHNAAPTAEIGLALLFSAAKFIIPFDQKLRQADWTPRYEPTPAILLHGKTILILGYGHIGRIIGQVCQALGMRVLAMRKSISKPILDQTGVNIIPASQFNDALPKADILMICIPLTPETENLVDYHALEQLPPGSILINIGRGPIVNERALYDNLKNGHLASAGLDVWYQYPETLEARTSTYPSQFAFQQFDNLVMSPHRGGATRDTDLLRYSELARLLNLYAKGKQMPSQVDIKRGY